MWIDHFSISCDALGLLTMLTKASYILTAVLEVVENSRPSSANLPRSRKLLGKADILRFVISCRF